MNINLDLGILITLVGLVGTVFGFVIKLSVNVGKYMHQSEALKEEVKEQNERTREKFNDYYAFKLDVSRQLSTIAERLESIQIDMKELKDEIRGK